MDQRIKQLLMDKADLQKQIQKEQNNLAARTIKFKEQLSILQIKNTNVNKTNEALKLEIAKQKSQIKLLEENGKKLRDQVGNSVDKSIAADLFKDINKLFENKLGLSVQGNRMAAIAKRINDIKECQICCHDFDHSHRKPVTAKCGHINCKKCMIELAHSTRKCPDCRATFRKEDLIPLNLNFDEL